MRACVLKLIDLERGCFREKHAQNNRFRYEIKIAAKKSRIYLIKFFYVNFLYRELYIKEILEKISFSKNSRECSFFYALVFCRPFLALYLTVG